MGYLRKYAQKYYKLFFLAVFFLSIEALCDLLQPMMMSRIVDTGIKNRDLRYVLYTGAVMVGITGIGAVGAVGRNILSSRVSQRFGSDLRFDLFAKIQHLPFDAAERFDPASLVTRLLSDVTQLQNFVNGTMRIFVKSPLLCIGSIIMAVALEPRLSLIILFVVPVIAAVILLNNRVGFPYFRRVQKGVDRLGGVMREYLSGVRVVKAFNHATLEEDRFSAANTNLMDAQTAAMRVSALFSPATATAMNLGIAAVLWFGGNAVNVGSVQVGRVIAFINYMTQMSNSFVMLSSVFTLFVRARASAERIGEVMRTVSEPGSGTENGARTRVPGAVQTPAAEAENPAATAEGPTSAVPQRESVRAPAFPYPNPAPALRVEFRGVGFSYGEGAEALRDVSFAVSPGESLGVIGTTGAGKTTLISLIPRFYEAAAGEVLVGGRDVRDWDVHALRGKIAVVPQKNVLFTGSILENIRWGDPQASEAEARRAADLAQIGGLIDSRPEGFGTLLGQGGVNLSGGQKQRLAIARALVKKPAVLLLDDCTSAVDVLTEGKIREGLRSLSRGMLCITVAQRIASVMDADRILVLDEGRVCGYGTHRELLQSCRVYRELYLSQYGKEGL